MSAIIFCSSFSAKSTIVSALYGSPLLDLLPQLDPPAFARPGDLLGLLAEVVQVKRPAHRKTFLQRLEGAPEPLQVGQVLVDGAHHGFRGEPGGEVEGDVEGGDELM